jgi:general secretion pathway protein M
MKAWFYGLQPRERWIVGGGAVLAVLLALWIGVLRPLHNETVDLRDAVAAKQRLLLNLGRVEGSKLGGPTAARPEGAPTLYVLVSNTAQQHGLTLPRTRPDGNDGINVSFQNASFDALLGWLVSLETEHAVAVESASFSTARQPGLVNGQLFLRRS